MTEAFSPVSDACEPCAANAAVYDKLLPSVRALEKAEPVCL